MEKEKRMSLEGLVMARLIGRENKKSSEFYMLEIDQRQSEKNCGFVFHRIDNGETVTSENNFLYDKVEEISDVPEEYLTIEERLSSRITKSRLMEVQYEVNNSFLNEGKHFVKKA